MRQTASMSASHRAPMKVIAGHCTAERHLQMRVWIDAARHDELAAGINDAGIIRSLRPSARLLWQDFYRTSWIRSQQWRLMRSRVTRLQVWADSGNEAILQQHIRCKTSVRIHHRPTLQIGGIILTSSTACVGQLLRWQSDVRHRSRCACVTP